MSKPNLPDLNAIIMSTGVSGCKQLVKLLSTKKNKLLEVGINQWKEWTEQIEHKAPAQSEREGKPWVFPALDKVFEEKVHEIEPWMALEQHKLQHWTEERFPFQTKERMKQEAEYLKRKWKDLKEKRKAANHFYAHCLHNHLYNKYYIADDESAERTERRIENQVTWPSINPAVPQDRMGDIQRQLRRFQDRPFDPTLYSPVRNLWYLSLAELVHVDSSGIRENPFLYYWKLRESEDNRNFSFFTDTTTIGGERLAGTGGVFDLTLYNEPFRWNRFVSEYDENDQVTIRVSEVSLPSVTNIREFAFAGNFVTRVHLPCVTTIRTSAFERNLLHGQLDLPSVEEIDHGAFKENELFSVNLPVVRVIGNAAFRINILQEVNLPSVESINAYAFNGEVGARGGNAIRTVEMPKVKMISMRAFGSNDIEELNLPAVVVIGERAFERNPLKKVILPSVKKIYDEAFYNPHESREYDLKLVVVAKNAEVSEGAFAGYNIRGVGVLKRVDGWLGFDPFQEGRVKQMGKESEGAAGSAGSSSSSSSSSSAGSAGSSSTSEEEPPSKLPSSKLPSSKRRRMELMYMANGLKF